MNPKILVEFVHVLSLFELDLGSLLDIPCQSELCSAVHPPSVRSSRPPARPSVRSSVRPILTLKENKILKSRFDVLDGLYRSGCQANLGLSKRC